LTLRDKKETGPLAGFFVSVPTESERTMFTTAIEMNPEERVGYFRSYMDGKLLTEHVVDGKTGKVHIPAFGGADFTDVEALIKANKTYVRWLRTCLRWIEIDREACPHFHEWWKVTDRVIAHRFGTDEVANLTNISWRGRAIRFGPHPEVPTNFDMAMRWAENLIQFYELVQKTQAHMNQKLQKMSPQEQLDYLNEPFKELRGDRVLPESYEDEHQEADDEKAQMDDVEPSKEAKAQARKEEREKKAAEQQAKREALKAEKKARQEDKRKALQDKKLEALREAQHKKKSEKRTKRQ
jgi:hypothetical protein